MNNFSSLSVLLHDHPIGTITHLPGDKNLFTFNQKYIDDSQRPTLSLSFRDMSGELITDSKPVRTRLPTFFSNLFPEGHMREYLASQAKVSPEREFFLLAALGKDLPGALKVLPYQGGPYPEKKEERSQENVMPFQEESIMRFSLAGIQLKFSAIWENSGGLTIPVDGVGGAWIIKLPSTIYSRVPENEFLMMKLAKQVGIQVPEIALIPIDQIHGLPKGIGKIDNKAFAIKRFDRDRNGQGVHIEDFAQVFAVYPERKYRSASYRNIAEVIWAEVGERGIVEFIRRFVFNALIGNGDMHLKNWSLIYPDQKKPALAPAYDFVSTIPYIPQDQLALTFVDSKAFSSLTIRQFKRFAAKTKLPETLVLETVNATVREFKTIWRSIHDFSNDNELITIINQHLKTVPLWE